jgi:hypothetical protein
MNKILASLGIATMMFAAPAMAATPAAKAKPAAVCMAHGKKVACHHHAKHVAHAAKKAMKKK